MTKKEKHTYGNAFCFRRKNTSEGNYLIQIFKDEAEVIRKEFPKVAISQTCKQKSKARRHKYYMEEHPAAMRRIKELRKNK